MNQIQSMRIFSIFSIIGILLISSSALADTHYVRPTCAGSSSNYTTWATAATNIQDAVNAASDNDTVLVTNGTYYYTRPAFTNVPKVMSNSMVVVTKGITITSVNGTNATIVNGNRPTFTNRCFYIDHADAVLEGFKLTDTYGRYSGGGVYLVNGLVQNCYFYRTRAYSKGGGVYIAGGIVQDCTMIQCGSASDIHRGGGAYVTGGTLRNCTLRNNYGIYDGSGVSISGGTVTNCIITGNTSGSAVNGGAGVSVYGGTVQNCIINSNNAKGNCDYGGGGGVYFQGGGTVKNCTINGNTRLGKGQGGAGAFLVNGGTLEDCVISGNWSTNAGGGVTVSNSGTIRNCLIIDNSTSVSTNQFNGGGGVYFYNGGTVQNCTIVSNMTPTNGGGVYFNGGGTITNSIIYFNTAGESGSNYFGPSNFSYSCTAPLPTGSGNITDNPQFVDAASENFRLLYTSPCNDGGTTNVSYTTDYDGRAHWDFNGNGTNEPDMGCYEFYWPYPSVNPLYFTNMIMRGAVATNEFDVWYTTNVYDDGPMYYQITPSTNWLISSVSTGEVNFGETDTVVVTNNLDVTAGFYREQVTVAVLQPDYGWPSNAPQTNVDVTMLVYEQGVVSSTNITNHVIRGTMATNLISLTNSVPDSTNNYTVSTNQSWLSVAPASGPISNQLGVLTNTVSAVGMAMGTYTGVVTIDSVIQVGGESFTLPSETVTVTMHVMELDRAPSSLTNSVLKGHDANTQTCTVWNAGPGELSYSISTNVSWLTVTPSSGISTGETAVATNTHTITYNSSGLSVGTHAGTITVTADEGGSPKMIDVTLTVNVQAELGVSPGYLENTVMQGQSPTNQTLCLWNASALYALGYELSENISWLNVSSNSGTLAASTTNNLTVTYNTTNLTCGTGCSNYSGLITITATNESGDTAIGSPQNVNVSVTVCPKSQLRVSPLILTNAVMEGYDASDQSFEVWNGNGFYTLSYNISNNVPWLMTSVISGTSTGEHDTIVVSYCTGGLEAGISNTTITVSAADATGSPQTIDVAVRIKPLAVLSCNATGFTNTIRQGQSVADASFGIWNGSAEPRGVLSYQVTVRSAECGVRSATSPLRGKWPLGDSVADVAEVFSLLSTSSKGSWLSVSPMSGTSTGETDTITVSINPAGLGSGKYSGTITVSGVDVGTGWDAITSPREISVELTVTATEGLDFDGDGVSDVVVYHESSGNWYILNIFSASGDGTSASRGYWAENFGGPGYAPVPGDYDGNGIVDLGVYKRSSGYWYARALGSDTIILMGPCGGPGYDPVCGDFNGDGRQDLAVYNERAGKWYVITSGGEVLVWDFQWGGLGLKALASDFDNDGCDDMAVYESSTGYWYIISVNGTVIAWEYIWGGSGFEPASGDYDGDGYADLATYHEGTGLWFITGLESGLITWGMSWGGPGFEPVVGDYDGDGRADVTVYYGGYWFIKTVDGTIIQSGLNWGGLGFTPVGM